MTHRSPQFISQKNKKEGRSDVTGKGKFFGVVLSELITASSERPGRRHCVFKKPSLKRGREIVHRKSNYDITQGVTEWMDLLILRAKEKLTQTTGTGRGESAS